MEVKNSQAMGMKDLIATLIVSGVLLLVGIVVFGQVKYAMNADGLGASATVAVTSIESTTYNAFKLGVVALIVLAAATIIGILVRAFGA